MTFYRKKFEKIGKQVDKISILQDFEAIKLVKDTFERNLSKNLDLVRVSAPLFVRNETGFNDDLNGVERKVCMRLKNGVEASIVQSLAKWKRFVLHKYGIELHKGIYADMNAVRIDEDLSNIHSYYVDQWDWEIRISKEDRTIEFLKSTVDKIYKSFLETDSVIRSKYPNLSEKLPSDVHFVYSQELEDMYPDLSDKEREYKICKEHKAVFLIQVGKKLNSGKVHDLRAPDYDDWELNGDILLFNEILDIAFELSSMGIRVSKESLEKQLKETKCSHRSELLYHKMVLNDELPFSIGGGIGQSRICMYLLDKVHIGEVQVSEWDDETIRYCQERNIKLL